MAYSDRVTEAFAWAHELHRDQTRKGSEVPYITHLMGVAGLTGEYGGDEDQVIAALLHDAVEDQGGPETLARIRARFGDGVASHVDGCTDTDVTPKPPWDERKRAFVESLRGAPKGLRLIVAADKLHNVRSIVSDLREIGNAVWERFTKGRESASYYRKVFEALQMDWDHPILSELSFALDTLDTLADAAAAGERQMTHGA